MNDCTDPTYLIEGTFLHAPGIGPKMESKLKQQGYLTWQSVLDQPNELPLGPRTSATLLQALACSRAAIQENDITYFINQFPVKEHWRILADYFSSLSYFDIETSGLSYDAYVTCIACYHQGQLHRYVCGENLDEFLDLLEEVECLVSFNGSSFDVPQLLRTWHIPELPCPHIDLRWQCFRHQLTGGLKQVEQALDIERPSDLQGVDGADAVWLWYRWKQRGDQAARERLLRYCAADVLTLQMVTCCLLGNKGHSVDSLSRAELWQLLDH